MIVDQRAQGLLVYPLPLVPGYTGQIVEFALRYKLAGLTFWEGYTELGFLIFSMVRDFAIIPSRRGRCRLSKALIPLACPCSSPQTSISLSTLRPPAPLGLTIPPTLLARADEAIE